MIVTVDNKLGDDDKTMHNMKSKDPEKVLKVLTKLNLPPIGAYNECLTNSHLRGIGREGLTVPDTTPSLSWICAH
jgi:hypothetical protein